MPEFLEAVDSTSAQAASPARRTRRWIFLLGDQLGMLAATPPKASGIVLRTSQAARAAAVPPPAPPSTG